MTNKQQHQKIILKKNWGWTQIRRVVVTVQNQQMEAYSVRLVTKNMNIRGEMGKQEINPMKLQTMTMITGSRMRFQFWFNGSTATTFIIFTSFIVLLLEFRLVNLGFYVTEWMTVKQDTETSVVPSTSFVQVSPKGTTHCTQKRMGSTLWWCL